MLHKTLAIAAAAFALMSTAEPAAAARFTGEPKHVSAPRTNLTWRKSTFNRRPQGPTLKRPYTISSTVNHHPGKRDRAMPPRYRPIGIAVHCDGKCPPKTPPGGTTECRRGKCPPPPKPPAGTAQCNDGKCPPKWPPRPHPLPPTGPVIGVPVNPTLPTGTDRNQHDDRNDEPAARWPVRKPAAAP